MRLTDLVFCFPPIILAMAIAAALGIGTINTIIAMLVVWWPKYARLARSLVITTLACVLGAVLYRFFIALALNSDFIGLKAQDLNLVTAVLVAFALLVPTYKRKLAGLWPGVRANPTHVVKEAK